MFKCPIHLHQRVPESLLIHLPDNCHSVGHLCCISTTVIFVHELRTNQTSAAFDGHWHLITKPA